MKKINRNCIRRDFTIEKFRLNSILFHCVALSLFTSHLGRLKVQSLKTKVDNRIEIKREHSLIKTYLRLQKNKFNKMQIKMQLNFFYRWLCLRNENFRNVLNPRSFSQLTIFNWRKWYCLSYLGRPLNLGLWTGDFFTFFFIREILFRVPLQKLFHEVQPARVFFDVERFFIPWWAA